MPVAHHLPEHAAERFAVRRELGRGSIGVVYHAVDRATGAEVAIKTLDRLGPSELLDLKGEFRRLAGVLHANLVELYELFASKDRCAFTMELVDGVDFLTWTRSAATPACRGLAWERLYDATRQLVSGLRALHERDLVHRDVKPSNVLATHGGRVVVLDFGLARPNPRRRDASPSRFDGTPAYVSPEQAMGDPPLPASDLYGVGVILYEAICGRLPIDADDETAFFFRKQRERPQRLAELVAGVPPALDELCARLLEPDPARRPGADEVLSLLDAASLEPPSRATRGAGRPRDAFVGRERERAALQDAARATATGATIVAHVSGESGIGKSELVRRFLEDLDESALVLSGRCHPHESVPFNALDGVVDALSQALRRERILAPAEIAATVRGTALLRIFPVLGAALDDLAPQDDALAARGAKAEIEPFALRRLAVADLRHLLHRVAATRRLVIWIDDAQWSDVDSAALLRDLLDGADRPSALVILSYRSEELASESLRALREALEDLRDASRIDIRLGPLDTDAAVELARRLGAGEARHPAQLAAIAAAAAGSPFLLGELVRGGIARLGDDPAAWHSPAAVQALLAERVRDLDPRSRRMLELVAIAGRPVERSVVLAAAGTSEAARPVIAALAHRSLLRLTAIGDVPAVEPYHDRIRETVTAGLSAEQTRDRHGRLAGVLARLPDPDPERLLEHYAGAGERGAAGRAAVHAAARARRALAFARAAELYGRALELEADSEPRWRLLELRAEALVDCGRAAEAGAAFETAAAEIGIPADDLRHQVLSLRRRAAEQYLRSGNLDPGLAATRAVLREVGLEMGTTPRRALALALRERVRLAVRGLRLRGRTRASLPAAALPRLDACWGAAISLSVVDPVLCEALAVRHLIEALALGERSRLLHALGYEAARLSTIGGPWLRRRSARILAMVEALGRGAAAPYDRAWVHLSFGTAAFAAGEWGDSLRRCDAAAAIWRHCCRGVSWEVATAEIFAITALAHLGDVAELCRRMPQALAEARDRGDVYASLGLRAGMPNLAWLVAGDPETAVAEADAAIARWPQRTFHVQHYLHALGRVHVDLYCGEPWRAQERLAEIWPRLEAARLLRMEMFRVEAYHLRARVAVACAAAPGDAPARARAGVAARLHRCALADAKRVARNRTPAAQPFASAIRAAVHAAGRRDEAALGALEAAAAGFAAAGMEICRAAAQLRAGRMRGGDAGEDEAQAALAALAARGVRDPEAFARVFAPGFA